MHVPIPPYSCCSVIQVPNRESRLSVVEFPIHRARIDALEHNGQRDKVKIVEWLDFLKAEDFP